MSSENDVLLSGAPVGSPAALLNTLTPGPGALPPTTTLTQPLFPYNVVMEIEFF